MDMPNALAALASDAVKKVDISTIQVADNVGGAAVPVLTPEQAFKESLKRDAAVRDRG